MPIRNEANYIKRSLRAVLAQDYPPDRMEVIIVDGMSTDGTREIIESICARYPNLQVVDNPGRIVPTGLNAGLRKAKGQIIIRVDGHCEIAPDYVNRCIHHLQQDGIHGVGGPIDTIGETFLAKAIAAGMSSAFGVGGSAFRTKKDREIFVDTVPFPAYKREVFVNAGLFDEELVRNQDDEYNYRLWEKGFRILLAPDIHSRYYSRSSLLSLWYQYYQYGYWKVRVMQKHPRQMRARQFVPLIFVIVLFSSMALSLISEFGRLSLLLAISSYIVANLVASILVSLKTDLRYLIILPGIFVILHLSYGLGFLVGLVKFFNRWGDKEGRVPRFEFSDS